MTGIDIMTTMQLHPTAPALPTFDRLGVTGPKDVNAEEVGRTWVESFAQFAEVKDIQGILSTLTDDGWWRDLFALTWDLRTFQGKDKIGKFLEDRLDLQGFANVAFKSAEFQQPFPDMAWVLAQFDFETRIARGTGIARLVPTKDGWKAVIVATNLEELKDYPEATGPRRNPLPNHGKWADQRRREVEYADRDPEVLVIGGGQCGLDIAARLKLLGVPTLIIEKQPRIGDQWRNRYEALCLHDPVCESACPRFSSYP